MREIKFRVWNNHTKRFIESTPRIQFIDGHTLLSCNEDEVIEQFTGLHDKNGKEIYEGDILDDSETELNYVIEFRSGEFIGINEEYGIGRIIPSLSEEGKVLGNIHDNKEILK